MMDEGWTDANYQSSGMESNQDAHTTNNGQPRALWIEEGNALAPKKSNMFHDPKTRPLSSQKGSSGYPKA
jgi:hypothetical protein